MTIRIKPLSENPPELELAPGTPSTFRMRRETGGDVYWLDIDVGPVKEAGTQEDLIVVKSGGDASPEIVVQVTAQTPADNIVLSAKEVSMTLSLSNLKTGLPRAARLGVRKLIGQFRIKSVSSTLPFLKFDAQAIVPGSNYLLRITMDPSKPPAPGTYKGTINVETDDPQKPKLQIPCTVVLLKE